MSTGALTDRDTGLGRVDENGSFLFLSTSFQTRFLIGDALQIDCEFCRVVLGVGEYLGSVE